jgi:crotonobetainyl-CoA:carnitine CoA-transferase CaiB-like acyl-CoA transferase
VGDTLIMSPTADGGTPGSIRAPAPEIGEHSRALLGELGVDERAYGRLREPGVASEGGVPNAVDEDQEVPG